MRQNDDAWNILFKKYCILDVIKKCGQFHITASQIKDYREPRLMTKFDHRVNLPSIFSDNNLSILPISRGGYIISSFSAYAELTTPNQSLHRISIPTHIQSLMPQFLANEAMALNCAYACEVFADFLEDDELHPTVSGRMSSGNFDFNINTALGRKNIKVFNSQIEIDAAYEGIRYFSLFEAKRDLSDDFLIRQLYYPFRVWSERVTKPIKPVFMVFSNGVFNLYQYQFDDPKDYNSIRLAKQENYMITTEITMRDIETLLCKVSIVAEPCDIPFPQADSMSRIISLIELLKDKPATKQDITSQYGFVERQADYYADAGRYLGLVVKKRNKDGDKWFCLSALGESIMNLPYKDRQLEIAKQILKHGAFKETLELSLRCGAIPEKSTIVQIMKRANLRGIESDETFLRRASTVICWVNWILELVDE